MKVEALNLMKLNIGNNSHARNKTDTSSHRGLSSCNELNRLRLLTFSQRNRALRPEHRTHCEPHRALSGTGSIPLELELLLLFVGVLNNIIIITATRITDTRICYYSCSQSTNQPSIHPPASTSPPHPANKCFTQQPAAAADK